MKKTISIMPINYTYDVERKSAHYTLDGKKFMNNGEFAEVVCKAVRGFTPTKDANTPFDMGSDIEQTQTSVKSSGCGLTDQKLADNREDFLKVYFERVHSTNVDWVSIVNDEVSIYNMNMNEFKEFTSEFARWDKYSQKVRIRQTSKMLSWLEERVG